MGQVVYGQQLCEKRYWSVLLLFAGGSLAGASVFAAAGASLAGADVLPWESSPRGSIISSVSLDGLVELVVGEAVPNASPRCFDQ